jgi:hypothetical protein
MWGSTMSSEFENSVPVELGIEPIVVLKNVQILLRTS